MWSDSHAVEAPPSARDRILVAAAHLYALRGYGGTSIRAIAERAGVKKPLIYYHFESKEGLYATLLKDAMAHALDSLKAAVEREAGPIAKLRALIRSQVALARQAPEIYLFVHEVMTMPGLLPLGFDYRTEGRKLLDLFDHVIEEGQQSGVFRRLPARLIVVTPLATLGIFVARMLADATAEIPRDFEDNAFEILTYGVMTEGGRGGEA